jgi:hypothetical protein
LDLDVSFKKDRIPFIFAFRFYHETGAEFVVAFGCIYLTRRLNNYEKICTRYGLLADCFMRRGRRKHPHTSENHPHWSANLIDPGVECLGSWLGKIIKTVH